MKKQLQAQPLPPLALELIDKFRPEPVGFSVDFKWQRIFYNGQYVRTRLRTFKIIMLLRMNIGVPQSYARICEVADGIPDDPRGSKEIRHRARRYMGAVRGAFRRVVPRWNEIEVDNRSGAYWWREDKKSRRPG